MSWLLGGFDRLLGTVIAASAGLAASQTQAFLAAYLQRLGGHLDEARQTLSKLKAGTFSPAVDTAAQERLATAFERRVEELARAYEAVAGADAFQRPIAFVRHVDRTIAEATLATFTPALPIDTASLIYALVGMVLGWMIYGLVKAPFRLGARALVR